MSERGCEGMTAATGDPCKAGVPVGRRFCIWHDPTRRQEAEAMRRAGGEARKAQKIVAATRTVSADELPGALETPDDGVLWAARIAHLVATGAMDGRTGDVVLRAVREHREGYRVAAMARRVAELEAALREARQKRKT